MEYSIDNIRSKYLEFFKSKNHLIEHSYSLIPKNDKSLLLIAAGMAPLKKYFTGVEEPPSKRIATCQKCVRTNDIENVGVTSRHFTFFEMLGNFSFGDYFKREAINWAWEFMTEVMKIDENKLWVSVYEKDEEAYNIWNNEININETRIVKLGKKDNFWELEVGPSGPCSEIYYDRGEKYSCNDPNCKPGCDCDRYVEVWNLVFTQYDKDTNGNYNPLPNPNIDTGMGLERMGVVLQDKETVFDIEPLSTIIREIEKVSDYKYKSDVKKDVSIRIICDHIRAVTFMIGDGIMPSNEGRGYVLRRLLRRAARHGKLLGINKYFLTDLAFSVIELWKKSYPELEDKQEYIVKVIKIEEEKFGNTINQGLEILQNEMGKIISENIKILPGQVAFKLYDTYGFPLELTEEILTENGMSVDKEEFISKMEKQRQRARNARETIGTEAWTGTEIKIDAKETEFVGYNNLSTKSEILSIYVNNNENNEICENDEGLIILNKTPFYAESGGQIGDKGFILSNNSKAEVVDTIKGNGSVFLHKVKVLEGKFKRGMVIDAVVNKNTRSNTEKNHSTTHILHSILKDVLGDHVNQAGSLVTDSKLRFDYTHFESISKETISEIEDKVNNIIFEGLDIKTQIIQLEEAKKSGVTALFDEKYGDNVRVVNIGDVSKELCGGTHVDNTLKIGLFKILSEGGIASGVRRIEAITGEYALNYLNEANDIIDKISIIYKSTREKILDKVESIKNELKEKEKEILKLKNELIKSELENIIDDFEVINGVKLFTHKFDNVEANELRETADKIKNKNESCIILLASVINTKVLLVSLVTDDLIKKGYKAGDIVKEAAKITGGGGGGRPNFAQAGGKNPEKIKEAFEKIKEILKN